MPAFEYDPQKSASNKSKHGIDFAEAQQLWKGTTREYALGVGGEMRYAVIAKYKGKHWTAIVTYRGATVRIISVRTSSPVEIQRYEHDSRAG
jgi:uncharacterized DUF497 family protein